MGGVRDMSRPDRNEAGGGRRAKGQRTTVESHAIDDKVNHIKANPGYLRYIYY